MSRDELLRELAGVSELIEARPWWQKNLLDEYYKSTSDTPRPVPGELSNQENQTIKPDNPSAKPDAGSVQQ